MKGVINLIIEQEYYTVAEVALLLRIKKTYIYELIAHGELKAIRISERRTRISKSSLEEFVELQINNQKMGAYSKVVQPPKRGRKPKYGTN